MRVRAMQSGSILFVVALLMCLTGVGPAIGTPDVAAHTATGGTIAQVEAYLDDVRDRLDIPGLAVRVTEREDPVLTFLDGRDGTGAPITPDTQFLIGSVAKSMTAALVGRRIVDGRVSPGTPISSLLPWLSDSGGVTVDELLTHRSGYSRADGLAVAERYDTSPGALRRAAESLHRSGLRGEFVYSDANYLVLGALIEELTGHDFAEVLDDELTAPAGMTRTVASAEHASGLPPGHRYWFGTPRTHDPGFDDSGAPYGYVSSTLTDMSVYAQLMSGAAPAVLPAGTLQLLHRPRVDGGTATYGYGWRVHDAGNRTTIDHTGATPGYFAHVLLGTRDRTVVVLANIYGEAAAPSLAGIAPDVLALLDGAQPHQTGVDTLLGTIPWVISVVAISGLVMAAVGLRIRRPLSRALAIVGSAGILISLWYLPTFVGLDAAQARIWLPDTALGRDIGVATWVIAVIVLVATAIRGRPPLATSDGRTEFTPPRGRVR
ncbi:serine hydrolase domain-containing protein [Gordonia sp. NPDC058843]|uniref:serine hydrolase domain-containing protein n=1 Tax=Gordonia sp. NPDC058843 TaxID=3346648 RepID=UPI00368FE2CB